MIPMCWKCANMVKSEEETGTNFTEIVLVGCKECDEVTDYASAITHCPLTHEYKQER